MGKRGLLPATLAMVAVSATFAGFTALTDFNTAPGRPVDAPRTWPHASGVRHLPERLQVVVFAHPKCECTAATLEQLKTISGANITVLLFRPSAQSDWTAESSWARARQIPGATVEWDDGGLEAKRFGGTTSGTVVLYGKGGELLFQGGITPSRGHTGRNTGLSQLQMALVAGSVDRRSFPVFGCSLVLAVVSGVLAK